MTTSSKNSLFSYDGRWDTTDCERLPMNALAPHLTTLLPQLWRFAVRLTRHHEDAQDLVQRTCVRALERQHQWRSDTTPLSWLYAILHSIWLNELNSRRLRLVDSLTRDDDDEHQELDVVDGTAADPETSLLYRQIVGAVETLPEAQRVVMLLVAVEGPSYREASDVLQVPIGTVMSRLSRARLTIGERFQSSPSMEKKNVT
jgi:RNA polymerase sigma-70 factor (ECF subfamily)